MLSGGGCNAVHYELGREPQVAHLPSFLYGCAIHLLSRMCSSGCK
jgi:hypothetical protein